MPIKGCIDMLNTGIRTPVAEGTQAGYLLDVNRSRQELAHARRRAVTTVPAISIGQLSPPKALFA